MLLHAEILFASTCSWEYGGGLGRVLRMEVAEPPLGGASGGRTRAQVVPAACACHFIRSQPSDRLLVCAYRPWARAGC